jgi:inosose dehydratase
MRLGYAAITWGGDDERAAREIAEVGFTAIQVRGSAFERYGKAPKELKDLLARHKLTFAVLSSGNLGIDPAAEASELAMHIEHAKFLRAAGGRTLQIIDQRPKRALVAADYARLGKLLTAVGQRTAELGVETVYHHHMNSIGEKPQEVDAVLETVDPKAVGILFDIAHYQQGGGDPVKAIRKYADRLLFLHIKDVEDMPGASAGPGSYRFVELGRGKVDVKGVFAAMRDVKFRGWAVVELDAVPDPDRRTPKESALINRKYLEDCGFTFHMPQATTRDQR